MYVIQGALGESEPMCVSQVAHCWQLGLEAVVVLEQYQVCISTTTLI